MAKQKTLPTQFSPNAALITGAGLVYGTQGRTLPEIEINTDIIKSVQAQAEKTKAEQENKLANIETRMSNYMANMSYFDTGIVPNQYLGQVQDALRAYKNEYFEVSQQLSNTKSTDPGYQDLNIRLSEINNGIKSIAGTFTDQKKNKDADILMFDKNINKLSTTNDMELMEGIEAIVQNRAPMKIENGVVLYELKGNWVKYEDIPELRTRADKQADEIGTMLTTLSNTTSEKGLTAEQLAGYDRQLRTMLTDRDVLLSLAQDKFGNVDYRDEEGMPITNAEELYAQDAGALREKMVAHYMGLIENAAKTGQQRNKKDDPTQTGKFGLTDFDQGRLNKWVEEYPMPEGQPLPTVDVNQTILTQAMKLSPGQDTYTLSWKWDSENETYYIMAQGKNQSKPLRYADWEEFSQDYTKSNSRNLK